MWTDHGAVFLVTDRNRPIQRSAAQCFCFNLHDHPLQITVSLPFVGDHYMLVLTTLATRFCKIITDEIDAYAVSRSASSRLTFSMMLRIRL